MGGKLLNSKLSLTRKRMWRQSASWVDPWDGARERDREREREGSRKGAGSTQIRTQIATESVNLSKMITGGS
jgi:hypothetical protein